MVGGAVALAALFVAGAVVQVPRTEADLTTRVESKLAAAGMDVNADFSGQDGTLRCVTPLVDPTWALTVAQDVWGVRSIDVDSSCAPGDATASVATTTGAPTTVAPTTVPATTVPPTTVPPTTVPPTTVPPTTLPASPVFTAALLDGRFILDGIVAGDLERLALVDRAGNALSPGNVVNNLTVEPQSAPVPPESFGGLLAMLAVMPINMVSGELSWNGSDVGLVGSYATDDGRAAIEAVAAQVGVTAALTPRATATAEQGAALEVELNAFVGEQPILFDKGSVDISLSSLGTVQQVAGIAKRYGGLTIEVQGHTDSEGRASRNMTLSGQRAAAVRDALVTMGVPESDLTSKGFGMTQLVRDSNGRELPDKSRRVVFGVTPI